MQVCTLSQITTPTSHHSVFYRLDALPAAQPSTASTSVLQNNLHWHMGTRHFLVWHQEAHRACVVVCLEQGTNDLCTCIVQLIPLPPPIVFCFIKIQYCLENWHKCCSQCCEEYLHLLYFSWHSCASLWMVTVFWWMVYCASWVSVTPVIELPLSVPGVVPTAWGLTACVGVLVMSRMSV